MSNFLVSDAADWYFPESLTAERILKATCWIPEFSAETAEAAALLEYNRMRSFYCAVDYVNLVVLNKDTLEISYIKVTRTPIASTGW